MQFLTLIKQSIYSPEFYRGLFVKPLSFSIKYFIMFAIAVSLVVTAVFSFALIPDIKLFLEKVGPAVTAYFPEELVVTVKNGEVSVNVTEPYVLTIPAGVENIFAEDGENGGRLPKNLVVIDTRNTFSEEAFFGYDTFILLMKKKIAFSEGDGRIRIEPLGRFFDAVINRESIEKFMGYLTSSIRSPFMVFAIFFFSVMIFVFHLVYLLLAAFLVRLVMKVRKVEGGYKKAYQVGIHAMTLGLLVNTSFVLMFWSKPVIPFLFTIILLVIVAVNLKPETPSEAPILPE